MPNADLVFVGYTHASIVYAMRPDVAHPGRTIRPAQRSVGDVTRQLCTCADERGHAEVWVRVLP